ncbi:unnamed protein product, partial [Iphiclides podalirius]
MPPDHQVWRGLPRRSAFFTPTIPANVIAALNRSNKTEPLEAIRGRHWQHIDSQSIRDTAVCVYILRAEHGP